MDTRALERLFEHGAPPFSACCRARRGRGDAPLEHARLDRRGRHPGLRVARLGPDERAQDELPPDRYAGPPLAWRPPVRGARTGGSGHPHAGVRPGAARAGIRRVLRRGADEAPRRWFLRVCGPGDAPLVRVRDGHGEGDARGAGPPLARRREHRRRRRRHRRRGRPGRPGRPGRRRGGGGGEGGGGGGRRRQPRRRRPRGPLL